jgi:hypothetical protein
VAVWGSIVCLSACLAFGCSYAKAVQAEKCELLRLLWHCCGVVPVREETQACGERYLLGPHLVAADPWYAAWAHTCAAGPWLGLGPECLGFLGGALLARWRMEPPPTDPDRSGLPVLTQRP